MTALSFGSLVLGAGHFGDTLDQDGSFAVLDAFLELGGRMIDTADAYSAWVSGHAGGESESVVGAWLQSRGARDRVQIATKVGNKPDRAGLAAAGVRAATDESLARLRTDHVDLYYAHRDDPDVPQEEVLGVLHELVRAGKVRAIGASNFSAARLRSAAEVTEREGLTPFTVAQDRYNLVERGPETEMLGTLDRLGVVEVPWAGLAHGFLAGAYRPGTPVASHWALQIEEYLADPRALRLLSLQDEIAKDHGASPAAVALAWLRAQPTVAAPVIGADTPHQLRELMRAASLELSPAELGQLSGSIAPIPR